MKRPFLFLLVLALLLSGCSATGERLKEPVTFYYIQSDYQYFKQDGVIVSEEREASGHKNDLNYLLALYLMGPSSEDLKSPLPKNSRILSIEQTADAIIIQIPECTSTVSDGDFSLACACLSMTCFNLTDAKQVTVVSGERSITMDLDIITFFDDSNAVKEAES